MRYEVVVSNCSGQSVSRRFDLNEAKKLYSAVKSTGSKVSLKEIKNSGTEYIIKKNWWGDNMNFFRGVGYASVMSLVMWAMFIVMLHLILN